MSLFFRKRNNEQESPEHAQVSEGADFAQPVCSTEANQSFEQPQTAQDQEQSQAPAPLLPLQESVWEPDHPVTPANLILEGGAMRCQFTAGVLDVFMERGLLCQRVVGTSAGALSGYTYVAGLPQRTCVMNMALCSDWHYFSMRSFALTGNALNRDYAFRQIPDQLMPFNYQAFNDSPASFVAVSSDLRYGEADYHEFADARADIPYLIASSSMPLVSQAVEVDGKVLLDGGTCDSIPLVYSLKIGAKKHIVVLTQDETYEKEPDRLMPLMRKRYADYPLYLQRADFRYLEYNRTRKACKLMHENGEIFVLMPPEPVTISSMEDDPDKLFDLYVQGRNTAKACWEDLQRYLQA